MRVLIHQQAHLGHHYQYVGHLLPSLLSASNDVVVAVTPAGLASEEFGSYLKAFSGRVQFEPALPETSPAYAFRDRLAAYRSLRESVTQFQADHVLIPSGDAQATAMAAHRVIGQGAVPGRIPCEVGIHFGVGRASSSVKGTIRDKLNLWNLGLSGSKVHLVNLLFYEEARALSLLRGKFALMPHPVTQLPRISKGEARRRLGIPEEGRYIGLAASLDNRKALGEFVEAFRVACPSPADRVLLAGWMHPSHQRIIFEKHKDLIDAGRLVIRNEFLEPDVFHAAVSALDVVCTPYPKFAGLSATLLEGVAAGRPILANAFGWSRAIVRRFKLGWTCDVLNPREFTETIKNALDQSAGYAETTAVERLMRFHSPENFGATWVAEICQRLGRAATPIAWEWVEETLPVSDRRLY